mmetsp:Transcript_11780/g.15186  ORF Transcript_11780/g.15186 Transcript_11780/m.15186 type:complete len:126 (+) Transcript_11780:586-963(+)
MHFEHRLKERAKGRDGALRVTMRPNNACALWENLEDSGNEAEMHGTLQHPPLILAGLLMGEQLENFLVAFVDEAEVNLCQERLLLHVRRHRAKQKREVHSHGHQTLFRLFRSDLVNGVYMRNNAF